MEPSAIASQSIVIVWELKNCQLNLRGEEVPMADAVMETQVDVSAALDDEIDAIRSQSPFH